MILKAHCGSGLIDHMPLGGSLYLYIVNTMLLFLFFFVLFLTVTSLKPSKLNPQTVELLSLNSVEAELISIIQCSQQNQSSSDTMLPLLS